MTVPKRGRGRPRLSDDGLAEHISISLPPGTRLACMPKMMERGILDFSKFVAVLIAAELGRAVGSETVKNKILFPRAPKGKIFVVPPEQRDHCPQCQATTEEGFEMKLSVGRLSGTCSRCTTYFYGPVPQRDDSRFEAFDPDDY